MPVVLTIQMKSATFEVLQEDNFNPIRQQKKKDGANNLAGGAKEDSEIDNAAMLLTSLHPHHPVTQHIHTLHRRIAQKRSKKI